MRVKMIKARVLKPFRDKYQFSREYKPGEIIEFDEVRISNMVHLGLAEIISEDKPKLKEKKEAEGKIDLG